MPEPAMTFPGQRFATLREDQQRYVTHLMLSWRKANGWWADRNALNRAIRKAQINNP